MYNITKVKVFCNRRKHSYLSKEFKRSVSPFSILSPSPSKERGTKGVRLIYNFFKYRRQIKIKGWLSF